MPVHVSIHDVSPAWEREVDVALEMAHAAGVRPALLVVPDYHARAPLSENPKYCDRLRALESDGHEVYLHGYFHRAQLGFGGAKPSNEKGLRHAFAQKVVSAGEAEFATLSRDEAIERLEAGERVLTDAGLTIRGFVAPAWSMSRSMLSVLGERGYRFTEDHLRIHDPAGRRSKASVVLNYASRTPGRLLSSVAWCRLVRPARRVMPARIAIHPADMRYALLRSEVTSLLEWASGDFVKKGDELFS